MKRVIVMCAAVALCALSVGCASSSMAVKRLDQDIPAALVEHYNEGGRAYVDQGTTWSLPLLFLSKEHIAKTSEGFQGSRDGSLGLGLLLHADQTADYDPKGRLLAYDSHGCLLTGLLLSQNQRWMREDSQWYKGHGWSVLWGAFGYVLRPDGARKIKFLWLPIPAGYSDGV